MKKFLVLSVLATVLMSLSFVSTASAVTDTCTWTGLGGDDNWGTSANWTCSVDGAGVAPELNDSLVFPAGAARLSNNNNFAPGTVFESILISGDGYVISGIDLILQPTTSTAVQITGDNNDIGINLEIDSASSATISNSGAGSQLSGGVLLNLTAGADMNFLSNTGGDIEIADVTGSTDSVVLNTATGEVELSGTNTYTASGSVFNISDGLVECTTNSCFGDSANAVVLSGDSETRFLGGSLTIPQDISSLSGANSPDISLFGGSNVFNGDLDINSAFTVLVNSPSTGNDFNGNVDIAADTTLNVVGAGDYSTSQATFNTGAFTGTGDFYCSGVGVDLLGASPAYAGDISIGEDCLLTVLGQSLGTSAGDVTVVAGGVLRTALGGVTDTINDDIAIEGTGHTSGSYSDCAYFLEGDDVDFTGQFTLTGETTLCLNNTNGGSADFQGAITGTGPLNLTEIDPDSGSFLMTGSDINDYTGATNVLATNLLLFKDPGGVGVPGNVNVEAAGSIDANLVVGNNGGNQVADSSIITLTNAAGDIGIAEFESSNQDEVVGTITGDGHLESDGSDYGFTIGGGNTFGTFSGTFDDEEGVITKIGTDTWTIDSSATFPGAPTNPFQIVIEEGSIQWDAYLPDMPVIIQGGTLKGDGDAGNLLASSGTVAPGTSPGCITTGETSLEADSILDVEINGTTLCSEYDQLSAEDIVINGAALNVDFGYEPAIGAQFTIIEAGTVSGTFDGLPDNTEFLADGYRVTVDYQDEAVVLTVVGVAESDSGATGILPSTGSQTLDLTIVALTLVVAGLGMGRFLNRRRRIHVLN
jgi:fibronectin-binding autotransporter adhesin